jgi:hypothetical protein
MAGVALARSVEGCRAAVEGWHLQSPVWDSKLLNMNILSRQLPSWREHADRLRSEIEELIAGRRRIIWDDGEDITREVMFNKEWELHCLRQLIEIAEERECRP